MLIIHSTDIIRGTCVIPRGNIDKDDICMDDIRELAEQIFCYAEDLESAVGRKDLLRQPLHLLPQPARELSDLFYTKMVCVRLTRNDLTLTIVRQTSYANGLRGEDSASSCPTIIGRRK